ncbi:UNVERIFIED_CONTAM: hypothetical protein FKN15_018484 [Acipenser sinensis]
MGDMESPDTTAPHQSGIRALLPDKAFVISRKGQLLIAEVVIAIVCILIFVGVICDYSTPFVFDFIMI